MTLKKGCSNGATGIERSQRRNLNDLEHAPAKKVEIVRRARNKTVCADALGINRKNIYRQWRQPLKDLVLKQHKVIDDRFGCLTLIDFVRRQIIDDRDPKEGADGNQFKAKVVQI